MFAYTLSLVAGVSMEGRGLVLSTVGVAILAYAQNRLDNAIHFWLDSLDFTVETVVEAIDAPGRRPTIRFTGMDQQTKRAVKLNRRISMLGWALTLVGFVLQLWPVLGKHVPTAALLLITFPAPLS
jgi:uncharacterized protein involved in cysteine biosynthesis